MRITDDAEFCAHRRRVLRIFENLFRNAVEHGATTPDSAASRDDVVVEVGPIETDSERGPTGLYVADNGPGVPADRRDRIFDDGYSTTAGGTGLGLTIVRELARAHGWTVTVCEGIDGGARFEFTGVALPDFE